MAQFSVGPHYFLTLESASGRGGCAQLPQQHSELVQRAGVDGTGIVLLGEKGMPFEMFSRIDCPSEADAHATLAQYKALAGGDLQEIVWRDAVYSLAHSVMYQVLGVTDERMQVMTCITGGLNVANGSAGVILEAIWHLCPERISS